MRKVYIFLLILAILPRCKKETYTSSANKPLTTIAFGSCCAQYLEDKSIFKNIIAQHPQLYIAGGDNVYADFFALAPGTPQYIEGAYKQLFASGYWYEFFNSVPVLPIWDDHDTGENDGTSNNPVKGFAKEMFFKYWKIPQEAPRHNRPDGGIYDVQYYGDDDHKVQIILLDLRWNHTPYKTSGAGAALSGYDTMLSPDATILGETQWQWLEQELLKPAKVRIIMSSLQFNSLYSGGENWAILPNEKQKMYDLIKSTQANGVVFLSGDVHFSELTKTQPAGMYPIYDVTASGLTHCERKVATTNDAIRVGNGYGYVNYGIIRIDWDKSPVELKLEVYGKSNPQDQPVISHTVNLDELKF